jgi:hypothetical protein
MLGAAHRMLKIRVIEHIERDTRARPAHTARERHRIRTGITRGSNLIARPAEIARPRTFERELCLTAAFRHRMDTLE